jgi:hypothetical protein
MRYGGERDPLVRIRLKRPHWKTGSRELVFEPLEFLARLLQHIPPLGFKAWRQYGAYSAVTRARWRALRDADVGSDTADAAEPDPAASSKPGRSRCTSAWAALLSRTWGFDPLECPDCGGRLEIVTAIHDPDSLERITRHYRLDTEVPELKPARAPPWHQQDLGGPARPGADTGSMRSRTTSSTESTRRPATRTTSTRPAMTANPSSTCPDTASPRSPPRPPDRCAPRGFDGSCRRFSSVYNGFDACRCPQSLPIGPLLHPEGP